MVHPDNDKLFSAKMKSISKSYILCDYNYMIFYKRQNDGHNKEISGYQELGKGAMNRCNARPLGQCNYTMIIQ